MDRTVKYIKMCEKAYKFLGKPKRMGLTNLWHEKIKSDFASPFLLSDDGDNKYFPIYRQDQLQETIKKDWQLALIEFCQWILGKNNTIFYTHKGKFTSMEQLWLSFVMAKKYQKHWDDTDWIKK